MKTENLFNLGALVFAGLIVAALWSPIVNLSIMVENRINPVLGPFYANDWRKDENGLWSAQVIGSKRIGSCEYVEGQIVTGVVTYPDGELQREVVISFIDDDSPDSTRPEGTQNFGRWQMSIPHIPEGSVISSSVQHFCPTKGGYVRSPIQPKFIVGLDTLPQNT